MSNTPITVAFGDGIGPEIMTATLHVLSEAGAKIDIEAIEIGQSVYERGLSSGIEDSAWETLLRNRAFLKSPSMTPHGAGLKSMSVTIRKTLGLYANVRPCLAYSPSVKTHYPNLDLVVIRENEEDLCAGVEHRQTDQVMQCLKLITRPGSEKIIHYAFEYARRNKRKKLTCVTKDNIMKLTDGLFHQVFEEIAADFPEIRTDHFIVDVCAAKLACSPEIFDVIVAPNLYGDILSFIAAQNACSIGAAGSANYGNDRAMFEAIHGTASSLVGRDVANPSGLLLSAIMMLVYIGQTDAAGRIHNAWLRTLEDGLHTDDIYQPGPGRTRVGTQRFIQGVVDRLGHTPNVLKTVSYNPLQEAIVPYVHPYRSPARKELVGVDVFLHKPNITPEALSKQLIVADTPSLNLIMITSRGVKVWPSGLSETSFGDHWRCRYQSKTESGNITHQNILELLSKIDSLGLDFIKCENLCRFDGIPGFAKGQGQ